MTHKIYINVYFIYFSTFPAISSGYFCIILPSSPIQGLEPGATPAVVGGVLLAILADRSSRKQKYLDYDVAPADGVEPPQGRAGRRMG